MSRLLSLVLLGFLAAVALACSSGSSTTAPVVTDPPDPFVLVTPDTDQIVPRGDTIIFSGTMETPEDYQYIQIMYDQDEVFANGNEQSAAYAVPAADMNIEWDTLAVDPGVYYIVIIVQKEGERAYGYPPITVTITGDELFTLISPTEDVVISAGETFQLTGTLRSLERFTYVEIYLDPDNTWGNNNEKLIMTFDPAVADMNGQWVPESGDTGTWRIAIVLYVDGGGGRLIGYFEPFLTVQPMQVPD